MSTSPFAFICTTCLIPLYSNIPPIIQPPNPSGIAVLILHLETKLAGLVITGKFVNGVSEESENNAEEPVTKP